MPEGPPQEKVEDEVGAGAEHDQRVSQGGSADVPVRSEQLHPGQSDEEEEAGRQHADPVPHAQPQH